MSWYQPKRIKHSSAAGIRLDMGSAIGPLGWGKYWMDAVARFCQTRRLERGLRCAKSGQVLSLQVANGFATAAVQGTRAQPYKVEIGLPMFTRQQWMRVVDALLKKAFFTAKLLAGEMPSEIEQIFQKAGAPLFPTSLADISSDCSCPDGENPCKHIAAVYYIFGQELNRDPFLLLEMRGLGRVELLAEIQARRSAKSRVSDKTPSMTPPPHQPVQTSLSDRLNDFFQSAKDRPLTWPIPIEERENLLKPGGRIHEMGSPPFWQSDNDFEEVLTRIYRAVRKRMMEL